MSSVPLNLPINSEKTVRPQPVDAAAPTYESPFVSTTTPTIERANRLIAVRAHPGFLDIVRISAEIRDEATAQLVDFGGWDHTQIAILKARAQAAKEHHNLLLQKIQSYIQDGLNEAQALTEGELDRSASELLDSGDHVRRIVLQKFEEADAARIPGSY